MQRVQRGFTLLELMIVVAIMGIILMIALPSFQYTIRSTRLVATTNQVTAAINLARSTAIRAAGKAGVCATSEGEHCGNSWQTGWLVWADSNGNGQLDDSEMVLSHFSNAPNVNVAVTIQTPLIFDSRGRLSPSVQASSATSSPLEISIQPTDCRAGEQLRNTLQVNTSGQTQKRRSACL